MPSAPCEWQCSSANPLQLVQSGLCISAKCEQPDCLLEWQQASIYSDDSMARMRTTANDEAMLPPAPCTGVLLDRSP